MCIYTPTKTFRKKVSSKLKPYYHIYINNPQDTHSHTHRGK